MVHIRVLTGTGLYNDAQIEGRLAEAQAEFDGSPEMTLAVGSLPSTNGNDQRFTWMVVMRGLKKKPAS